MHFIKAGNVLPGTGVSMPRGNHSNWPKSSVFASQYCDTSAEAKAGRAGAGLGGRSAGTPSPAPGTARSPAPHGHTGSAPQHRAAPDTGEPVLSSAIRGEEEETLQGEGLDHVGRQVPSAIIFWNG